MEGKRPSKRKVKAAIVAFLKAEDLAELIPHVELIHDGDDGWAWWTNPDDTTSYVHHDLKIEWLGSSMPTDEEDDG